jgi:O-6-methylguanine DNA methyltransferase
VLPVVLERVGLVDRYASIDSVIGPLFVAFSRVGVSSVTPAGSPVEFEQSYRSRFGRRVRRVEEAPEAIAAALQGRRAAGRPRVDLRSLAPFQRAVLHKAIEIPRGEVRTYGWVAREIGKPAAVRAVGTALRRNPIPLIIPCHRVVRGDNRIGEYGLGSAAKWTLLEAEGAEPEALESLGRAGVRYLGSDSTKIFCFPTCRNARRIQAHHRVAFGSPSAATSAGYRPCKVCRPALAS